jgi:hypothetical protein
MVKWLKVVYNFEKVLGFWGNIFWGRLVVVCGEVNGGEERMFP